MMETLVESQKSRLQGLVIRQASLSPGSKATVGIELGGGPQAREGKLASIRQDALLRQVCQDRE